VELSREQVCCQTVIDLLRLRTKVFSLQGPGIEKLNIRDQFNLFGLISYVMMSGDNMPLILNGCRYNSINGCLYYSINGCLYYGGKGCRQANSLKELNNIELSRLCGSCVAGFVLRPLGAGRKGGNGARVAALAGVVSSAGRRARLPDGRLRSGGYPLPAGSFWWCGQRRKELSL